MCSLSDCYIKTILLPVPASAGKMLYLHIKASGTGRFSAHLRKIQKEGGGERRKHNNGVAPDRFIYQVSKVLKWMLKLLMPQK